MKKRLNVLAVDLGASHGRIIKGSFDGNRVQINVIHDFHNRPIKLGNSICWNHISLAAETIEGISKAGKVASIGVDSWGHDFIPVTQDGSILGSMYCYRDERTARTAPFVSARLNLLDAYMQTGMGTNPIATICQLAALKNEEPKIYEVADGFLFVADYINYLLCGARLCNETQVSMGGMYDMHKKSWCTEILKQLSLKESWGKIAMCGEVVGKTQQGAKVVTVASHDTASALSFLPYYTIDNLVISSGTWALIGIKAQTPVINKDTFENDLQIELGSFGQYMQIHNLTGMWLLQELSREWHGIDYNRLNEEAKQCDYVQIIDTQNPELSLPGNMAKKICSLLEKEGKPIPTTQVEFYRCILLSLCEQFNKTIQALERIYDKKYKAINIVGGGTRNAYFNSLIADTTNKQVCAGPYEAAAVGNVLTQLIALGEIADVSQAATVVEKSFEIKQYFPQGSN